MCSGQAPHGSLTVKTWRRTNSTQLLDKTLDVIDVGVPQNRDTSSTPGIYGDHWVLMVNQVSLMHSNKTEITEATSKTSALFLLKIPTKTLPDSLHISYPTGTKKLLNGTANTSRLESLKPYLSIARSILFPA